jgi:hypothetical protein
MRAVANRVKEIERPAARGCAIIENSLLRGEVGIAIEYCRRDVRHRETVPSY